MANNMASNPEIDGFIPDEESNQDQEPQQMVVRANKYIPTSELILRMIDAETNDPLIDEVKVKLLDRLQQISGRNIIVDSRFASHRDAAAVNVFDQPTHISFLDREGKDDGMLQLREGDIILTTNSGSTLGELLQRFFPEMIIGLSNQPDYIALLMLEVDVSQAVKDVITKLEPDAIGVLTYMAASDEEGLSVDQIARHIGLSANEVRNILHKLVNTYGILVAEKGEAEAGPVFTFVSLEVRQLLRQELG